MSDGRSTSAGFAPPAMRQSGPALAVLGLAGPILVDGILAVFVCGLAFNGGGTGSDRAADVPIDEAVTRFLVLPLSLGLGVVLPWSAWADLGWK